MALFDRLTARRDAGKIPVHQFCAAMQEMARGEMTRAEVIALFALDAAGVTQLDQLIARFQQLGTNLERFAFAHAIQDILLLAEAGLRYTTLQEAADRIGRI